MKVDVFDMQGQAKEKIDLPRIFSEPVREDLIVRAVLVTQSRQRQPYGTDPLAGQRSSAHYHSYRRHRWTMMNREMARLPRIHGKTSPHLSWAVRLVPQATGGRRAHPPKAEKIWSQKINKKERQLAIRSAVAATAVKEIVLKRGHRVQSLSQLPIVAEDRLQEIKKTKNLVEFLKKIGLKSELERIQKKKIRAGRGKNRGRKYRKRVGPLFVITEDRGVGKAVGGLSGCNVCKVENLSAAYLAPGASAGRLTIFTTSAIKKLESVGRKN